MGKRKTTSKESELQENSREKSKTSNNGSASGKFIKPDGKRPKAKCSTVLISVLLVGALSIIVGLIIIEVNLDNKDFKEHLLNKYYYTNEKQAGVHDKAEKLPPPKSPEMDKTVKDSAPIKDSKESMDKREVPSDPSVESKKTDTAKPPSPKKTKPDDKTTQKPPQVVKDDSASKLSDEKIHEIETQVEPDLPPPKSSSPAEDKGKKAKDEKKQPEDKKTLKSDESQGAKPSKEQQAGDGKEDAQVNLTDLYLKVESLAEDIQKQQPDNEMVKQLAPHLEGVLKDMEEGKLTGLKDSLLHIEKILLDLKDRLAESKKPKTKPPAKDENRVPVEEVIPDPIYIAPRGDDSDEEKEPAKSSTGKDDESKRGKSKDVKEKVSEKDTPPKKEEEKATVKEATPTKEQVKDSENAKQKERPDTQPEKKTEPTKSNERVKTSQPTETKDEKPQQKQKPDKVPEAKESTVQKPDKKESLPTEKQAAKEPSKTTTETKPNEEKQNESKKNTPELTKPKEPAPTGKVVSETKEKPATQELKQEMPKKSTSNQEKPKASPPSEKNTDSKKENSKSKESPTKSSSAEQVKHTEDKNINVKEKVAVNEKLEPKSSEKLPSHSPPVKGTSKSPESLKKEGNKSS